jgi:PST family polysaccharide transporter
MYATNSLIDHLTLIKTSLLNAIAVGVKMITLLAINKVLAIYVGPAGYAALGQFQNAVQMISTLASGAINTGVTKYTAEYKDDELKQRNLWKTAGSIALTGSLALSILVLIFNDRLAMWFLADATLGSVFIWFAATLVLFVFNGLFLAILNGKKEINKYVAANIAGSIFAIIVTTIMVINYGAYGALVALAVYQSLTFIVTYYICYKSSWFKLNYFYGAIDKKITIDLSKFALMALVSAICTPLAHIFIRNHLVSQLGWSSAGYWEAMYRLSSAYLLFVTTTLGLYYLPRLSELKETKEIISEIKIGYKFILPIACLSGLIIYGLRDVLIRLLFTEDFISIKDLFAWQLIGDTMKIGSWILSFLMLAKGYAKEFIVTEIIFTFSFYRLVCYFVDRFGLEGVVIAHALNYLLYWIAIVVIMNFKLRENTLN